MKSLLIPYSFPIWSLLEGCGICGKLAVNSLCD